MINNKGNIIVNECIDDLYIEILKKVVNGKYQIEFEDEKFEIKGKNVFENLKKLTNNPLYKNLIIT